MSKHVHFIGVVIASDGASPEFLGPFIAREDAVAAVQEELTAGKAWPLGGVVPFDVVEALPVAPPAPASEKPAEATDKKAPPDAGAKKA